MRGRAYSLVCLTACEPAREVALTVANRATRVSRGVRGDCSEVSAREGRTVAIDGRCVGGGYKLYVTVTHIQIGHTCEGPYVDEILAGNYIPQQTCSGIEMRLR